MRYSDIKVGHVYYADLNPVQPYEFGGNHLCVVLEKCADNRSVTIISLTSKSSGLGGNKEVLSIADLPIRLTQDRNNQPVSTYAIFDQIRTVVSNRLQYIYDGKNPDGSNKIAEVHVGSNNFDKIITKLADLKIKALDNEKQTTYHKDHLFKLILDKMLEDIFSVIKARTTINNIDIRVKKAYSLLLEIKNFELNQFVDKEYQEEVQDILNTCLKGEQSK